MTICIATICENRNAVVVASDRMVTAQFLALEFEHPGSKIEIISKTCVGLTAGDALAHTELFRACRGMIGALHSPTVGLIADQVNEQFGDLRRKRAEDVVLKPRGMTLNMFYQGQMKQLPLELSMGLDSSIQNATFPLSIIIAGVDDTGAHLYGIENPGVIDCYDSLSYHAVGSGTSHALLNIIGNEHSIKRSLKETLYEVYEAKRKAELAQGVGEATEIGIITINGVMMLSDNEKNLLEQIYAEKISPQLDEIQELITQLPIGNDEKKDE